MSEIQIDDAKKALRGCSKAVRADAHKQHGATAATQLADIGIGFAEADPTAIVSGFLPIRDEIDPVPLMQRLHRDGHALALPVMQGNGQPLVMRSWAPGDEMDHGQWGIEEPRASAAVLLPDVVLVPLLAFDTRGQRLGYGRGYYDRTLASLAKQKKIISIGIAYDEQQVDEVPCGQYDQPLDWMLTPSGPSRCSG